MKLTLITCLLLSIISCTSRLIDCTIISTKSFELSDAANYEKLTERVEGDDVTHIVIFIPLGLPDVKEACDTAIEQTPGCVGLSDAVLYSSWFYIPYIYGQIKYTIEGTPIVKKGSPKPTPKKKTESKSENTVDYSGN